MFSLLVEMHKQILPHLEMKHKFINELVLIGIKAVYEKNM